MLTCPCSHTHTDAKKKSARSQTYQLTVLLKGVQRGIREVLLLHLYTVSKGSFFFLIAFFFFFLVHCVACGILDRTKGPLQWKHGVLTTGPPGKSKGYFYDLKKI